MVFLEFIIQKQTKTYGQQQFL